MSNIAIHGFGRIGRSILKAALRDRLFVPVSISDIRDLKTFAALFAVDTNYGLWPEPVRADGDDLVIGDRRIRYINSMEKLPDWQASAVDLVVDCTGRATVRSGAQAHLDRGAKRVLVSAPSKSLDDCDAVLLRGINLEAYDPAAHRIVSMASCTTNALAPVVKVVRERFGITMGFFSTVHAYTNTQSLTDQPMKRPARLMGRGGEHHPVVVGRRQGAFVHLARPEHHRQGLPRACAHRQHRRAQRRRAAGTTADAVRDAFRQAAASTPLAGVMGVLEEEFASARIVGERLPR